MTEIVLHGGEQSLTGDRPGLRPRELRQLFLLLASKPDDLNALGLRELSDDTASHAIVQDILSLLLAVLDDGCSSEAARRDGVETLPLPIVARSNGISPKILSTRLDIDWASHCVPGLAAKPRVRPWIKSGTFAGAAYAASLHRGSRDVLNVDFYLKQSTGPIAAAILRLFDEKGNCINEDVEEHRQPLSKISTSPPASWPEYGELREIVETLNDGATPVGITANFDVTNFRHATVAELILVPAVSQESCHDRSPTLMMEGDGSLIGRQKVRHLKHAVGLVMTIAQRNEAVDHVVGLDGVRQTVIKMQRMARSRVDVKEEAALKFLEVISSARLNPLAFCDAVEATRYANMVVRCLTIDRLRKRDSLWGASAVSQAAGNQASDELSLEELEPNTRLEGRLIDLLTSSSLKERSDVRKAFLTFCDYLIPDRNNAAELLWARDVEQVAIAESAEQLGIKRSEAAPRVSRFIQQLRAIITGGD